MRSSIGWYLEGLWLPIHSILLGLRHTIRGHKVRWFVSPMPWRGHFGFIMCYGCSDTTKVNGEFNDLCIWGHYWPILHRLAQWICGKLGHREAEQWMKYEGEHDDNGEAIYVESGRWFCGRCLADMPDPSCLSSYVVGDDLDDTDKWSDPVIDIEEHYRRVLGRM